MRLSVRGLCRLAPEEVFPLLDNLWMREKLATKVFIKAAHRGLEAALAGTVASAFGKSVVVLIDDPEADDSGDIVVTTDGVTSPGAVSELAARGHHVVVLAALADEIAAARYWHAGASAYLPLVAAVASLTAAVGVLLSLSPSTQPG